MQEQMPDVFFSLARSMRAGLSLEQALTQVGNLHLKPLSDEIRRCAEQLSLGLSVPAALQLAAQRIQLPDFNVFASVVSLHRSIGGNLGLMLDRLATSTRDRNLYLGYFRSTTILGRITAIVIGLAVPLIFLYYALFQPDYIQRFFETGAGVTALIVAAVLEAIGVVWLYFLMKVDY
jgi:tight adherence protein B